MDLLYPDYKSTRLRAPRRERIQLPRASTELTGPALFDSRVGPGDHDLTAQHDGEPLGERIIVHGRVLEHDGRCITRDDGSFEFVTIKPGAYPWGNHHNAWRPAHIHFSVFGRAFAQRLVTQMYFPGDPLFGQDPIYQSAGVDAGRLVAAFDLDRTKPEWALAYRWDIVLARTPFDA